MTKQPSRCSSVPVYVEYMKILNCNEYQFILHKLIKTFRKVYYLWQKIKLLFVANLEQVILNVYSGHYP